GGRNREETGSPTSNSANGRRSSTPRSSFACAAGEIDLMAPTSADIRVGKVAALPQKQPLGLYLHAGCPHPQRLPCELPVAQASEQYPFLPSLAEHLQPSCLHVMSASCVRESNQSVAAPGLWTSRYPYVPIPVRCLRVRAAFRAASLAIPVRT